jgi:hypothetical protein
MNGKEEQGSSSHSILLASPMYPFDNFRQRDCGDLVCQRKYVRARMN